MGLGFMVVLVLSSQVHNETQTSNNYFLNLVYVLFLKTSLGSSTLVAGLVPVFHHLFASYYILVEEC
jgi:hypothetical protein